MPLVKILIYHPLATLAGAVYTVSLPLSLAGAWVIAPNDIHWGNVWMAFAIPLAVLVFAWVCELWTKQSGVKPIEWNIRLP